MKDQNRFYLVELHPPTSRDQANKPTQANSKKSLFGTCLKQRL